MPNFTLFSIRTHHTTTILVDRESTLNVIQGNHTTTNMDSNMDSPVKSEINIIRRNQSTLSLTTTFRMSQNYSGGERNDAGRLTSNTPSHLPGTQGYQAAVVLARCPENSSPQYPSRQPFTEATSQLAPTRPTLSSHSDERGSISIGARAIPYAETAPTRAIFMDVRKKIKEWVDRVFN